MTDVIRRTLRRAMDDNITGEAAKAAYYFFFSLFPLILVAFSLTGVIGGERAFEWFMQRIETLAPGEGGEILEGFVTDITQDQRFDLLSIGLLLAIWAGSNFFAALGESLDNVFRVRDDASFFKRRGKALLMLFVGGALLVAGATAILLGPTIVAQFGLGEIAEALRWPLGFALIAAQMFLMYYILPNRDQSNVKREIAAGALVATAVWMLATGGFSFYVQNFADYNQTYGAVGAVIILMMWLFITALAVLLGGELAHVLEERAHGNGAGSSREPRPDMSIETPRVPIAPAATGAAASSHGVRVERADAPAHREDHRFLPPRDDQPRADSANGERSSDDRGGRDHEFRHARDGAVETRRDVSRWGTSLALHGRARDGHADYRQRRQHMEHRNEGLGARDPLETGTGDIRSGEYGREEERGVPQRGSTGESVRERGEEMLERGRERAHDAADTGRSRLAGKLEEYGDRLEERGRESEGRGGIQERAGRAAVRAGHALDDSAEYLRSHDVDEMRDDLERQIRERPLISVGIALGAGFLLARMLRD
jgi:membrane protein